MTAWRETRAGFTLIELLAATAIISLLIAAVSGVVMTAFNLRTKAQDALDETLAHEAVADLIRKDLELMVAPTGLLAGAVLGETEETSGELRSDSLEFYAASGVLTDQEPWGAVQEVTYRIEEPEDDPFNDSREPGRDLVRTITRNLLPVTEEEPEETVILHNVRSLTFSYYDGETWQDTWDSTTMDNEAPEAVSVRIEMVSETAESGAAVPVELICEVASRSVSTGEDAEAASEEES